MEGILFERRVWGVAFDTHLDISVLGRLSRDLPHTDGQQTGERRSISVLHIHSVLGDGIMGYGSHEVMSLFRNARLMLLSSHDWFVDCSNIR